LGEKARTLDFLVELVGAGERTLFFFAQVKTTRKGYTKKDRRLKVEMSATDVRRATLVPAPTYLIGIDDRDETAYIAPILEGMTDGLSSIPTTCPLDCVNLPRLYEEVEQFWSCRDMRHWTSVFSVSQVAHERVYASVVRGGAGAGPGPGPPHAPRRPGR
jgi:hypothetical protein